MKHLYFNFSKNLFKTVVVFSMIIFLLFPTLPIKQDINRVFAIEAENANRSGQNFSSNQSLSQQSSYNSDGTKKSGSGSSGSDALSAVSSCLSMIIGGAITSFIAKILSVPNDSAIEDITTGMESVKTCIMDGVANALKRMVIRSLVSATVDWINGGFDGSPQYGKNLSKTFKKTVDDVLGEVIYGNEYLKFLCSDFEFPIKLGLHLQFSKGQFQEFDYTPRCTLSDVGDNIENAVQDGIDYYSNTDNFFSITTNAPENVFQTYFKISKEVEKVIGERNAKKIDEYNRNKGFFGFRRCNDGGEYDASKKSEEECPIVTPGTILAEKLAETTNTEANELITADEFDEIIGAILNQLFQKLLQKDGGIRGMSETSADTGTTGLEEYQEVGSEQDSEGFEAAVGDELVDMSFKEEAPDVMAETIESILRVLDRSISIFEQNKQCWSGKTAGDFKSNGYNNYTILQQATINEAGPITVTWLNEAKAQRIEYQDKLNKVNQHKQDYLDVIEKIRSASFTERNALIVEANKDPIIKFINSVAKVAVEKRDIENQLDERVNGKYSYSSSGTSRKYSAIAYLRYCQQFNIPYDSTSVDCSDRDVRCGYSKGFWEIENTSDYVVKDGYDAIEAIENLQNGSNDITADGVGECLSADGKVVNYGDREANFYTKKNGTLFIHENGGVCGAGSIITDDFCNLSYKSSEVYLFSSILSNTDITNTVTINSVDKCDGVEEVFSCETEDEVGFEDQKKVDKLYSCDDNTKVCYQFNSVRCDNKNFIGCSGGRYLYNIYAGVKDEYKVEEGSCEEY